MNVLVVSKTRVGGGRFCVGGLDRNLNSLRLCEAGWQFPPPNSPYEVGQVWDLTFVPRANPRPPHVEDVAVTQSRLLRVRADLADRLGRTVKNWQGDPTVLFDGILQFTGQMRGYVEEPNAPDQSTGFWLPTHDLELVRIGNRPFYRYRSWDLSYVGVAAPIDRIPAGTLVRVSLARWWKPQDAADDFPERCYLQLSGWYQ